GIFFSSILLISNIVSFSQKLPPGTIKVKELDLFIDKNELKNIDWLEYLYWLKKKYGENSTEFNRYFLTDVALAKSVKKYQSISMYINKYQQFNFTNLIMTIKKYQQFNVTNTLTTFNKYQ
ncbi:unnamed protein product, partial [marine sediment metagenome]